MPDPVRLRPLRCGACGAHLLLGQGTAARCSYCGAETAIPDDYQAVQRAAQSFARDTQLARQLYGLIGKPPGAWANAIARGIDRSRGTAAGVGTLLLAFCVQIPPLGLGMILALAYLLGYPVSWLLRGALWIAHRPSNEPLSAPLVLLVTMVGLVPPIGVWLIRRRRDEALFEVRRDIHGSLAASLPERPGGPSQCRNCGAALDIPQGALGVPCAYCQTDNLVALPEGWVAHVRAHEFRRFLRIDDALDAYRLASAAAREQTFRLAFFWLLAFPAVVLLGWLLDQATIHY